MLRAVEKIEGVVLLVEKCIMIGTAIALPAMVSLGVFFRYILHSDLYAIEEIEMFIAMWLYFTGAAYASYQGSQITADIVQAMVKSFAIRKAAAIAASAVTFVVAATFFYWGTDMIEHAILRNPRTAVWKLPLLYEYLIVYVSFFLMALYALKSLCRAAKWKETDGGDAVSQQGGVC